MVKVFVEGNYFIAIDTVSNKIIEHPRAHVKLKQSVVDDDIFTVFYSNQTEKETSSLSFSNFIDENDLAFTDQDIFISWFRVNTGESYSSNGGTDLSPLIKPVQGTVESITPTVDGSVPSGAITVSFVFMGDGGTLNGATRRNLFAKEFSYPNGDPLPAFTYTVPTSGEQEILIDILR